jgi:endonuclease/exonuclease/phosphatase family metal-dependent hydrolase
MDLRVLVHNVKGFRAGADETAAAVAEHLPDVALISEAGTRGKLRRYCHALGMEPAAPSLLPLARTVRNAVLVRPPWRVVRFHIHRFHESKRFYPRGALVAHVGRAGYRVWALAVHLGLATDERLRHVEELTNLSAGLTGPVVVGGDFNEGPQSAAVRWMAERYWDAWEHGGESDHPGRTFPSGDPSDRIDYLFVSEQFRVEGAWVLDDAAATASSDHLPLVVDLTLD